MPCPLEQRCSALQPMLQVQPLYGGLFSEKVLYLSLRLLLQRGRKLMECCAKFALQFLLERHLQMGALPIKPRLLKRDTSNLTMRLF